MATLTTELVQGRTASPILFRFFIEDLAGDLREVKGGSREPKSASMEDPGKLVADDVILISHTAKEMQDILNVCTKWAKANRLEWKPAKCIVVVDNPSKLTNTISLAG